MMHLRNEHAFTLIEVLLAIAIIGFALTPILMLNNTVLGRVFAKGTHLTRHFFAKQFLFEAREKKPDDAQEFSFETQKQDPPTRLVYRVEPATRNPHLHHLDGLVLERVTATWQEEGKPQRLSLVTFDFVPVQGEGAA